MIKIDLREYPGHSYTMSSITMEPLRSQSRLDVLMGSMMAGKTSALIRLLTQLSEMGLSALYINHGIDTRAKTTYSTHSPLLKDQELNIITIQTVNLSSISVVFLKDFNVIGIDEAQFFDESLVPFVQNLVEVHKKYVIVAGLDGNFRREKFGHILDLIPIADNVTKLHAYCKRCAEHKKALVSALFTHYVRGSRESSGFPTKGTQSVPESAPANDGGCGASDEGTVIVGGAEKYEAVCRDCYLELS